MVPAGVKTYDGAGLSGVAATIRLDAGVITTLWVSADLSNWSQVTFSDSADQSGVPTGFRRVERTIPADPEGPSVFYRFNFSR